jgi:sec-independent protein translocase protein TatA
MGLGGISIWQLLIILVIVVLLFGTKRLGSLGSDLGSAIRGFRKSMQGDEDKQKADDAARITDKPSSQVIDGEVHRSEEKR